MATFSPCKGCVRLWRKGQLPGGDAEEAAGRAGPVWAEVGEDVLRGYSRRKKVCRGSMGGRLRGKSEWRRCGKGSRKETAHRAGISRPVSFITPVRAQQRGSHGKRRHSERSELCPNGRSEGSGTCADAGHGVGQNFLTSQSQNFLHGKTPRKRLFSGHFVELVG